MIPGGTTLQPGSSPAPSTVFTRISRLIASDSAFLKSLQPQQFADDRFGVPTISDILVNGADEVFVERRGRLEPTGVMFADDNVMIHRAHSRELFERMGFERPLLLSVRSGSAI